MIGPNPVAGTFGRNLRRARRRVELSQEEAAVRSSLHRTEISLLERGERTPRIDTLVRLAGAVGVSPGELLEGIEWTPGFARPGEFGGKEGK